MKTGRLIGSLMGIPDHNPTHVLLMPPEIRRVREIRRLIGGLVGIPDYNATHRSPDMEGAESLVGVLSIGTYRSRYLSIQPPPGRPGGLTRLG